MPQSQQNDTRRQATQPQQHQDPSYMRDYNNNEIHSRTIVQAVTLPNEPSVIDLCTQDTILANQRQSLTNVESEIRSLAVNIAADTLEHVDDVLILQYAHNNNNNSRAADSELMHFNGIHIRNNNSRNHTNPYLNEQSGTSHLPRFHELGCDNAQSGMFHASVSVINGNNLITRYDDDVATPDNLTYNPVSGIGEDVEPEGRVEARVSNGHMIDGRGDGVDDDNNGNADANVYNSENVLYETPSEIINSVHINGAANSPIIQTHHMDANEYMAHEYLVHGVDILPNNVRRGRPRRRGQHGRGRPRHQIRRSLNSMNKILRKTAYTLRRIKSLLMQQVQMARNYYASVPISL